jgi:holliday junction DNA helicase RuvA
MFAYIKGQITYKSPTFIVVENFGIGYEIQISLNTFSSIKDLEQVQLITWLNIREDAHVIYGFYDLIEKELFLQLISVNGIGPNTARSMLSYTNPSELKQAIVNGQLDQIQRIKGIGLKTAQRLVLELKEKLLKLGTEQTNFNALHNNTREEALMALMSLGIPKSEGEKSLDAAIKASTDDLSLEELIKTALKSRK